MATNQVFTKSASEIARYGGRIFAIPYGSKLISDTAIGVLVTAMSTGVGEDVVMETSKGFPTSGTVLIGSESIPYTAKDINGTTLTVTTRSAPAAHTEGSLVTLVDSDGYGATLKELGYIEKFAIESGKKDETVVTDCNGDQPTAFAEPAEPVLKITGLQSDINTISMGFGVDTVAGTDGFTYLSETELANYAIYIYIKQQKGNSAGFRYGVAKIANAKINGNLALDFSKDVQKLDLNFKLLDGTDTLKYYIGQ